MRDGIRSCCVCCLCKYANGSRNPGTPPHARTHPSPSGIVDFSACAQCFIFIMYTAVCTCTFTVRDLCAAAQHPFNRGFAMFACAGARAHAPLACETPEKSAGAGRVGWSWCRPLVRRGDKSPFAGPEIVQCPRCRFVHGGWDNNGTQKYHANILNICLMQSNVINVSLNKLYHLPPEIHPIYLLNII